MNGVRPLLAADRMHRLGVLGWAAGLAGPLGATSAWLLDTAGVIAVPSAAAEPRALLFALVLAPVIEELAFRGALQDSFRSFLRGLHLQDGSPLTGSNLLTSAAFAACHWPQQPGLLAASLLLPSLLLGRVREVCGSVVPCVALHAWFNACFALAFWR